jgi:hypothetical protein
LDKRISHVQLVTYRMTMYNHRRLCRVKNMLAMYLKYHKAGLTPTTPVTSITISPVKMSIGRKSLTNLRSEMIFLQGKPVFYIFLPSTPPYWQIILRFCWQWTPKWQQSESRSRVKYFCLSVVPVVQLSQGEILRKTIYVINMTHLWIKWNYF